MRGFAKLAALPQLPIPVIALLGVRWGREVQDWGWSRATGRMVHWKRCQLWECSGEGGNTRLQAGSALGTMPASMSAYLCRLESSVFLPLPANPHAPGSPNNRRTR